jgi:hypothetical protein
MALSLRNGALEPARATVRIVVLDERGHLKGSVAYCTGDPMQPGTRQTVTFPLEIRNVRARDRIVIVTEQVLTTRREYGLKESLGAVLTQARRAAEMRSAEVNTIERTRTGDVPPCPCECGPAEETGREACGQAELAAFTCTPMTGGACSESSTCK